MKLTVWRQFSTSWFRALKMLEVLKVKNVLQLPDDVLSRRPSVLQDINRLKAEELLNDWFTYKTLAMHRDIFRPRLANNRHLT